MRRPLRGDSPSHALKHTRGLGVGRVAAHDALCPRPAHGHVALLRALARSLYIHVASLSPLADRRADSGAVPRPLPRPADVVVHMCRHRSDGRRRGNTTVPKLHVHVFFNTPESAVMKETRHLTLQGCAFCARNESSQPPPSLFFQHPGRLDARASPRRHYSTLPYGALGPARPRPHRPRSSSPCQLMDIAPEPDDRQSVFLRASLQMKGAAPLCAKRSAL
ncbi:hypothetical protein K458DRAFT_88384 [Lentithecium fluviatile CBS 122367]|uniref:Uncharacterized protein n=1 Tax=Lentithecium fluviatile CBS 122367 TaxID=1168545 RepID=A0A6G1IS86_9PLEO|nr:hypothetical protein K458DRAFT_88384 [Lentithecium fluviatile CBS 122367]